MTTPIATLIPIPITAGMIISGTTVSEPAAGEIAWVSAGTYAIGDLRIRSTTHRVYACVQAHSGRAALPENDAAYWLDKAPTQRFAPFDVYTSTAATSTGSITFVIRPGYFNSLALYGLIGATYSISIKDAPGGSVIYTNSGGLSVDQIGWYEYLFAPLRIMDKLIISGLPIRPAAELTVTISAAPGASVGIGMINVGDFADLLDGADWGGPQYGATSEPVSYSYIKVNTDGTTSIVKRVAATSMRVSVQMPAAQADYALQRVRQVLDVPVSWIVNEPGFSGLNVFGLGSAVLNYDQFGSAKMDLTVKGFI